jgi:hypothetical protein
MLGHAATANAGRMTASQHRRTPLKPSPGILLVRPTNSSDSTSNDSLRRRIQRIETLLHGRQASNEPQNTISSALTGIEKLLGIPPQELEPKPSILIPLLADPASSPTTLPSPAGSQNSQVRSAFLAEANHKRWGAESAIGQSWSKASPLHSR